MPRKKRSRKKPVYKPEDFELMFEDRTMVETEGKFERVDALLKSEFPYPKSWNIKTKLTLSSPFGEGNFVLDFRHTKHLYIIEFSGGQGVLHNPELSNLTRWATTAGWEIPQPSEALIIENPLFWKHMWEVLLIDSPYFDKKFGLRKSLDMRFQQDMSGRMESDDDDEEESDDE